VFDDLSQKMKWGAIKELAEIFKVEMAA
jgi:hypothetical protein